MSSTSIAAHPSSGPVNSAAFAAELPSDLSHSPLIGILGVILGAGIVTLSGRLLSLFLGGMESPRRILTFSAFFHVTRLFAGQIGVALMVHFIAVRERWHSFLLGLDVQRGDWITESTVRNLTAGLAAKSSGLPAAAGRAVGLVDSKVRLQAYALTFIDAFHFIAWVYVGILLLIAMLRASSPSFGDLKELQPKPTPSGGKS